MTQVMVRRPTQAVRRGLRLIANLLEREAEDDFERLFPAGIVGTTHIDDIVEAVEWLEQYATAEVE